jgi:hypothetical protein
MSVLDEAQHLPSSMRIYSYDYRSGKVNWESLLNAETGVVKPCRLIYIGACWVELPDRSLFFAGGFYSEGASQEAWRLNVTRDFSVVEVPLMHSHRYGHQVVYFQGFVYAICGGTNRTERYCLDTQEWQELEFCVTYLTKHSAIALEATQSIYVLGGRASANTSTILAFSVVSLTWSALSVALPAAQVYLPCFKVPSHSSSIFFVHELTVYRLEALSLQLQSVKSTTEVVENDRAACYYWQGSLYCTEHLGSLRKHFIGSLLT